MAQRALPPGAIRRRAFFGLLDADGWTAAFAKALFWFALIILLLGYIPDRAYYATVSPTIDVGYNAISPINFCDAGNKTLPCPAPPGSFVPWESSPPELALPAARVGATAVQSGENLYLVGGRVNGQPTADVVGSRVTSDGNLDTWKPAAALPEARADAAIVGFGGVPYVIGGVDQAGSPTDTVFQGVLENGALTGWQAVDAMKLPQPLADASAVSTAAGLYLFGGRAGGAPVATVYRSVLDTKARPPALKAWEEQPVLVMPEPRADAPAVSAGKYIYVLGGEGPQGPTNSIFRLELDTEGNPRLGSGGEAPLGWAQPTAEQSAQLLPGAVVAPNAYAANSALYAIGGTDPAGNPVNTTYWAVPDPATGNIPEWKHLDAMDLPQARRGGALSVVGSFAFLIGGETAEGAQTGTLRANVSPKPPFFRLGMFGATLPALSIKGEIGQQLGYINAFSIGLLNFTILVIIGVAMSHREGTQRFMSRLSRGRIRPPRENERY
ncbi:MAG: hypothetical protein H0W07_00855 [Chloroflexi bacterium]|nr:hypothetical protein [Chloroflexota bacterium]